MGMNRKQRRQSIKDSTKTSKIDLQFTTLEVVVPVVILLVFLIAIMLLVTNIIIPRIINDNTPEEDIEAQIWEQTFLEAEKQKVGIVFEPASTTEDEYALLRNKCNEYIELEDTDNVDTIVSVDTIVDEQQFIDGDLENINTDTSTGTLAETGPIYFHDMLMLRYINNNGDMHVVTALFNPNDRTDIRVIKKDALASELSNLGIETKRNAGESDEDFNWTSEVEYLSSIDTTLKSMFLASTDEEIREAERLAINYFTLEGKQTVFGNRSSINVSPDTRIKTVYMEAGKSDTTKTYKDRIYMQFEFINSEGSANIHIILKLNSNYRIFDVDIV